MASPTWWTWVWASSRSWWWTAKPGMLQSIGLQRVRHDWETELNWLRCVYVYVHTHICIWITLLYTWNKHNINYTSIKNFLNICKPINPKGNQSWIFTGGTDAEAEAPILLATKEPTHWKRPWCWERLKAGGEGGDRGWEGWMASPTQWTWV